MGNPKLKWTAEEEEALLAGIEKHGPGKWKNILTDPEFASVFSKRTNIDLKDKWRNITVSSTGHHGMKDKSKIPKLKSLMASASANANGSESLANAMVTQETPLDVVMEDVNITAPEPKNAPKYNDLIFKAVASSPNGLDISGIFAFIEKHQVVPTNFRRHLSSKLGRLVGHGKLERVKNCYFIKGDTSALPESKTPSVTLQKDTAMEEASTSVAYMVADADYKSYLASEAVKEAEIVMKMFEDAECFMHLAEEIHDRCVQGQIVLLK